MVKPEQVKEWWREAKYGMFIHWGVYSVLGGEWQGHRTPFVAEWIMARENISREDYLGVAKAFDPQAFDAEAIVALAKRSGMNYMVYTAKHHDGFAMYHSKCCRDNIIDATPFDRDPLKELSLACQNQGMKLCLYYSHAQDWLHPQGYNLVTRDNAALDFDTYLEEKALPQLEELLTDYGPIGLIWFDSPIIISKENSQRVYDLVKSLQPECMVSYRIGNECGDYYCTGDNQLPTTPMEVDWEMPGTTNDSWGYKYYDHNWKDPSETLRWLIRVNSRGGNYLLNVGPDGHGVIPAESAHILEEVGAWLGKNGEAIYGTKVAPMPTYHREGVELTYKPGKLYMHVFDDCKKEHIPLFCLKNQVKKIALLGSGETLSYEDRHTPVSQLHEHVVVVHLPKEKRDQYATVVCIEIEGDLEFTTMASL